MINTEYIVIIDDNEDVWNLTQNIFEKEKRISTCKDIIRKTRIEKCNVDITGLDNNK